MLQGLFPGLRDLSDRDFPGVSLPEYFNQITDHIDDAVFGSDEFRMFAYKIKRCPRTRSHDWTECPYAHRGEKAQRRDPSKFQYSAVACPAFRNGSCQKADFCEFAHGVFEYWLHPARYRTRACNAGRYCQRKVCFFAHTPEQLRSETKHKYHFNTHKSRMPVTFLNGRDPVEALSESTVGGSPPAAMKKENIPERGISDHVNSLKGLNIRAISEREKDRNFGWDVSDSDLPHIGWISELVQ